jgi:hypothetical protein
MQGFFFAGLAEPINTMNSVRWLPHDAVAVDGAKKMPMTHIAASVYVCQQ